MSKHRVCWAYRLRSRSHVSHELELLSFTINVRTLLLPLYSQVRVLNSRLASRVVAPRQLSASKNDS